MRISAHSGSSSSDRRRVIVRLSPAGVDAFDHLQATSRTQMGALLADLDRVDEPDLLERAAPVEQRLTDVALSAAIAIVFNVAR